MRFGTGLHPRQWHRGVWVLVLVFIALLLLLTHRSSGGRAFAMEPSDGAVQTPVEGDAGTSNDLPAPPAPGMTPDSAPTAPEGSPATPDVAPAAPEASSATPDAAPVAPDAAPSAPEAPPADPVAPPQAQVPTVGSSHASAPSASGYTSEIVNNSYTIGPAEFFALDLPMQVQGARAVHLSGTVRAQGKKDIMVRLFKSADYDRWLKQKSGRKPVAYWTSPRANTLTLDKELPPGQAMVLLLDNGYSIRSTKKVTCQLSLRYQRGTDTFDTEGGSIAGSSSPAVPKIDTTEVPEPRSNSDQELPPPPPPPPGGY